MSTKHYHQRQQLIQHNASLIQNNYYSHNIILKTKAEEVSTIRIIGNKNGTDDDFIGRKIRISDEIYFLICQSCFWCASYYITPKMFSRMTKATKNISAVNITKCPSCIEGNIESLPITENEEYKFDYDTKREVILEFLR
jgi:hypothetical protein